MLCGMVTAVECVVDAVHLSLFAASSQAFSEMPA